MTTSNDNLAQLLARLANGRSLAELESACGGVPSRSRIWQLQTKEMKSWPAPDVIRGLAKGLGVSPEAIVFASANSLGFHMQEPSRLAGLLPAAAANLDDQQISAVLSVVAAMNPGNASRE